MMGSDLFWTEAQKSRRMVVEDVTLLLLGQEVGRFDRLDRDGNCIRPVAIIRAENDPLPKPSPMSRRKCLWNSPRCSSQLMTPMSI